MSLDFSVTMAGLSFRTPLLTGSGTFGYGDEFLSVMDYAPLGGLVTKSISIRERKGNPPPRICETPGGGVINSIGLANPGVEAFIRTKAFILPVGLTRVFLSVFGETVEEFIGVISRLESVPGVDGYELNLSCPNVKSGGISLGGDSDAVIEIVRESRSITKRFIAVKLTPHHIAIAPLAEAAAKAGADALTLTNTLVAMMIDAETRKPMLGTVTGGYSGPPLKPVSLAKVWQASKAVDVPIWAGPEQAACSSAQCFSPIPMLPVESSARWRSTATGMASARSANSSARFDPPSCEEAFANPARRHLYGCGESDRLCREAPFERRAGISTDQ